MCVSYLSIKRSWSYKPEKTECMQITFWGLTSGKETHARHTHTHGRQLWILSELKNCKLQSLLWQWKLCGRESLQSKRTLIAVLQQSLWDKSEPEKRLCTSKMHFNPPRAKKKKKTRALSQTTHCHSKGYVKLACSLGHSHNLFFSPQFGSHNARILPHKRYGNKWYGNLAQSEILVPANISYMNKSSESLCSIISSYSIQGANNSAPSDWHNQQTSSIVRTPEIKSIAFERVRKNSGL